jgi:hypothetical protein
VGNALGSERHPHVWTSADILILVSSYIVHINGQASPPINQEIHSSANVINTRKMTESVWRVLWVQWWNFRRDHEVSVTQRVLWTCL